MTNQDKFQHVSSLRNSGIGGIPYVLARWVLVRLGYYATKCNVCSELLVHIRYHFLIARILHERPTREKNFIHHMLLLSIHKKF